MEKHFNFYGILLLLVDHLKGMSKTEKNILSLYTFKLCIYIRKIWKRALKLPRHTKFERSVQNFRRYFWSDSLTDPSNIRYCFHKYFLLTWHDLLPNLKQSSIELWVTVIFFLWPLSFWLDPIFRLPSHSLTCVFCFLNRVRAYNFHVATRWRILL